MAAAFARLVPRYVLFHEHLTHQQESSLRVVKPHKDIQTTLLKVSSVTAFSAAIEKRPYHIAKRIETYLVPDILEHKSMMWHGECRRCYTMSAEKLRFGSQETDGLVCLQKTMH